MMNSLEQKIHQLLAEADTQILEFGFILDHTLREISELSKIINIEEEN